MSISRLRVASLRNIDSAELELGELNIISGANGSGKTSLLEAIYLLGSGRSFRTTRLDALIRNGSEQCTVHANLRANANHHQPSLGISRNRDGEFEGRIHGRTVRSAAELARCIPVLVINTESFALLDGSPALRRHFLDWGVFHVEQEFHQAWMQVQRSLKQRNALLRRDNISPDELEAWTIRLGEGATKIDSLRRCYFDTFYPLFQGLLHELRHLDGLELTYARGWDRERNLQDVLHDQLESDHIRGLAHSGPHRADVRARLHGMDACNILSRGQQKLVVCAMKLAQVQVLKTFRAADCVVLVDDLPAELDRQHQAMLCRVLARLGCQVLITAVDHADLDECWNHSEPTPPRVFHVEHGVVTRLN